MVGAAQLAARHDRGTVGRRGAGRLRGRAAQPGGAGPAVRDRLSRHPPAGGQGRTRGPGADRGRRALPGLGRAPGRRDLGRVLHQPRSAWRPGRGRLRVQLRRRRAARPGHRGGLQRRRDDQGRLGDLAGGQAARPLPRGQRPALCSQAGRGPARVPAGGSGSRPAHAGDRAHPDRRRDQPAGQRVLPLLPRVHPGPDQGPAALPRPHHLRGDRAAASDVEPGPAGHARRRVPGLRRGRGPVGPRFGLALRGPDHRLRVRPGLRPAAADEPHQGGDVPDQLAAAQGHAVLRRAGRDAARAGGVGPVGGPPARAGRRDGGRDPGIGVQHDGPVRRGVPGSGGVRAGLRAGQAAAAGQRPGGPAAARVRVPGA